jgi:hypothetical protein
MYDYVNKLVAQIWVDGKAKYSIAVRTGQKPKAARLARHDIESDSD